jgi:hypothetical protein
MTIKRVTNYQVGNLDKKNRNTVIAENVPCRVYKNSNPQTVMKENAAETTPTAVTIEIGNSTTAPEWRISDRAMEAFVNMCVDICRRNPGIRQKNGSRGVYCDGTRNASLTLHEMFSATNCPGPFIKSRIQNICSEINSRLAVALGNAPAPQLAPSTPPPAPSGNIAANSVVTINPGAKYGGLTPARGISVPSRELAPKQHTIVRVQTNNSVSEALLREINSWVAVSSLSLTSAPTGSITAGSRVRVRNGASNFNGGAVAAFVYQDTWIVREINGDRVVINMNISGRNAIMTPFRMADLTLVQ